jgi:hypothetical protein
MSYFTYEEYKHILDMIKACGYTFGGYHEILGLPSPACLVRHDLDLEIDKAFVMAEIEDQAGISTTYCVMLRSAAYNIFSSENTKLLNAILEKGHHLGLHFDCGSYSETSTVEELADACRVEVRILEDWIGHTVRVVSYHKPTALVLAGTEEISYPLPHTYMAKYMKEMTYLSDSYGFWRVCHPLHSKALREKTSMNLSMHPIWWSAKEKSSLYCLTQAMQRKKEEVRQYMLTQIVGV